MAVLPPSTGLQLPLGNCRDKVIQTLPEGTTRSGKVVRATAKSLAKNGNALENEGAVCFYKLTDHTRVEEGSLGVTADAPAGRCAVLVRVLTETVLVASTCQ